MYLRKLNRILLVVAGLLVVCGGYAQETPFSDYADFESLGGIYVTPPPGADDVCPSLDLNDNGTIESATDEVSSTNDFFINAYQEDMGDPDLNTFEWVVYGGWIKSAQGDIVNNNYSQQRTGNIRYSYVVVTGVANPAAEPTNYESYITVEWDTTNFSPVNGWVAVRQTSEYDCTLGQWQVFTNDIVNNPPSFDTNFPSDIDLPRYFAENQYTLPLPSVSDADNCNQPLFRTFTVERPVSGDYFGDENDPDVQLDEGENLVTWTVSDGSHEVTQSYTITVEPAIEILNIAWTNPRCENENNGSLLVTNVTDYTFSSDIEYSFDGSDYADVNYINTLAAGEHNVKAQVVYSIDTDNDPNTDNVEYFEESDPYICDLSANTTPAFDALPGANITDAGCFTTEDGKIEVDLSGVDEYNSSVSFDGSSFMHINKKYENETLNQFSIATWVKADDAAGTLLSFDNERYFQLALTYSGGSNATRVRFQTNTEQGSFTHTAAINDGNWHLVVASFNNGYRAIYIDGVKEEYEAGSIDYVGGGSYTRYGMIGARSTTTDMAVPEPNANFFTGQMAEMAIWEGIYLGDAEVQNILKHGIRFLGPTDHWVLNDIPSTISSDDDDVYTDLGNSNFSNYNHWASFNGGSKTNGSPKHYYWTNEDDDDIYPASTTLENVGVGDYTLHVTDMFGCGEVYRTYTIENSDEAPPELYWNAALLKQESRIVTASQSSDFSADDIASNAVDGLANTSAVTQTENTPWLDIDLGGVFSIRTVNIYANNNFGDFWVMTSLTPFDEPNPITSLEDDRTKSGVTAVEHSEPFSASDQVPVRITDNSARYVRIRATGNVSINVAEVEVLSNSSSPEPRVLQLTSESDNTDCFYPVTSNDLSIIPFDYDACDGIVSYVHDASHSSSTDLNGFEMPLGDTEITWTATDDKDLTEDITITYRVEDVTPPEFHPWPFSGNQTISYCDAEVFTLSIPTVVDNYSTNCGTGITLELYRGTDKLYTYNGTDTETNVLFDDLTPGEVNVLEWHATDESDNETVASLNLDVQIEPRVLEVKTSPITCNNAENSVVTFSRIDTEPGVDVRYILSSESPDTDPDDEYNQTNDPVFTGIPDGTYYAYVIVNECASDEFGDVIVIDNPDPIELYTEVTPVECFGQPNGAIDLTVTGGSRTNVLHFLGDDDLGADASNYGAINLAGEGTLEGWIYLDELGTSAGETNYNTQLFGVDGNYGFRIENGQLVFFAGTEELSSNAISPRQWIHIAGTWSAVDQEMNLMVDGAVVDDNDALATDFDVPDGGDIYFGVGGTSPYHGFIRNVRIWKSAKTETEIINNFYMVDPIDVDQNLVANYPINAGGGSSLQNRALVSGVTTGDVNTTEYAWQRFAYYWENSAGEFVERTQDLSDIVADDYTVYVDDPMGCPTEISDPVNIPIADNESPTLTFSNEGYGGEPLESGDAIWRYTPEDDCVYLPEYQEFDPVIDDHGCPVEDVTLTFEVVDGAFGVTDPAYDPTGESSLDGAPMTDIIRLRWTAEDKISTNDPTVVEVDYYIIDNQMPEASDFDGLGTVDNPIILSTDEDKCSYLVEDDETNGKDPRLGMTFYDNCYTGDLTNDITGTNTLEGHVFDKGIHTIRWTYVDKTFPGEHYAPTPITVEQYIEVYDNEDPEVSCLANHTVQLNQDGEYELFADELDDGSLDNCVTLEYSLIYEGLSQESVVFGCNDLFDSKAVTFVVTDESGKSQQCESTVTVEDNILPIARSGTFTFSVSDQDGGEVTIQAEELDNVDNPSSDNCAIVEYKIVVEGVEYESITYDCDDLAAASKELTLRVTDASGNSDDANAFIILEDDIDPTAVCQGTVADPIELELDNRGLITIIPEDLDGGSYDNCGGTGGISNFIIDPEYTILAESERTREDQLSLDCGSIGPLSIPLMVIDNSYNDDVCTAEIEIVDKLPPVIASPTYTLLIPGTTNGVLDADELAGDTYDNCGGTIEYQVKKEEADEWAESISFSCQNLENSTEVHTVWLQAEDQYGNTAEEQTTVIVESELKITNLGIANCSDEDAYPIFVNVEGYTGSFSTVWESYDSDMNPFALLSTCDKNNDHQCFGPAGDWDGPTDVYSGYKNVYLYTQDDNLTDGATYIIRAYVTDNGGDNCSVYTDYEFVWSADAGNVGVASYDVVCPYTTNNYPVLESAVTSVPGQQGNITYVWNDEIRNDNLQYGDVADEFSFGDNSVTISWNNPNEDSESDEYFFATAEFKVGTGNNNSTTCYAKFDFFVNIRPPIQLEFVNPEDPENDLLDPYATDLCPLTIDRYQLAEQDMTGLPEEDEWIYFDWQTDASPEDDPVTGDPSHYLYEGGNITDNYADYFWETNNTVGTVSVTVTDRRGCDATLSTPDINKPLELPNAITVQDITDPVLNSCPDDVVRNTYPGECYYRFGPTELPQIKTENLSEYVTDSPCLDEERAEYYQINSDYNSSSFDKGITIITWSVTDVGGNESNTCEQTITVIDNEGPMFTPLENIDLTVDDNCEAVFPSATRVASASDNCGGTVTYDLAVDFGNNGTDNTGDLSGGPYTNDPAGIPFPLGTSKVTITATDDADAPNSSTESFLVTVTDEIAPTINVQLDDPDLVFSNDEDACGADVDDQVLDNRPGVSDTPDESVNEIDDNCSDDGTLIVTFDGRSDNLPEDAEYPVGTTIITWRVTDESGNETTAEQEVTIEDTQIPWFESTDPALQDESITYCDKAAHRLPIPTAYDNCDGTVESITWTVTGVTDSYNETGTILASNYPNLKPNGGFTEILTDLPADDENGSDYTVEWTALDEAGNSSDDSTPQVLYEYTLHVEKQPNIDNDAGLLSDVYITPLTCGNSDDGIITIANDVIRVEDGATVEYSNDGGLNYQSGNTFERLPAGNYSVIIRANGCESNTVTAVIPPKADYEISLTYDANAIDCWDDETGTIDVVMTGGEPGQILFNGGSGISAADYATNELDLTSRGAIEAWVYLESLNDATLISKGSAYALRLVGGKFTIDVGGTYLDYPALADNVNLPKTERWYHVTGTWDANSNSMRVFINGEQQTGGSINGTLNPAITNNDPVTIGNGVNGIIRDVRIWSDTSHGAVPTQSLVITDEENLVGYWKLQDGSGGSAHNECVTRISGATDATGVSGWVTDYPQPGYYSWKRYIDPPYLAGTGVDYNDQTPYSNPVHLENIGRGRYELTFIDQYSCPEEPGLIRNATFVPTDAEIPNIPNIGNQTVELTTACGTNCDNCQYVVQSTDTHLWPQITDDCYFETTWRVTPYKTNVTTTYTGDSDSDSAITDAILELGENRVEVTATQNDGDLVASFTYFITVVDKINPEAIGQSDVSASLSNNYEPMGSGIVYYNAAGFNNGSSDNCTSDDNLSFEISSDNGVTWGDELSFTCDDIGSPVQIAFKVIDEAGNKDIVSSGSAINIFDEYDPVFISLEEDEFRTHSSCVTVDNDNTEPLPYTIYDNGVLVLDASDYSDNCNVVAIDYALEHEDGDIGFYVPFEPEPDPFDLEDWTDGWKGNDPGSEIFYEGTTYVWFRIVDSSGNTSERRIYEVEVLPKPAPQTEIE
jgi:hypothetical protein